MTLFLALLIPVCIGLVAFKVIPGNKSLNKNGRDGIHYVSTMALHIVLGTALGAGICSCIYFICLWLFGTPWVAIFIELALLATLIVLRKRWSVNALVSNELKKTLRTINIICILLFIIFLVNSLLYFIVFSLQNPHGQWDAIAMWNLKARFLYLGGMHWRTLFSRLIGWSHSDYPLLLPSFIANCWTVMKTDAASASIAAAAFFTLGTGLLIFLSLSHFKGVLQGLVAGLLVLSTPFFMSHGVTQYADIPLGFFFLATLVSFTIADETENNALFFCLVAGLFTGFAAWTKNEGILFSLVVIFSRTMQLLIKPTKMSAKKLLYFALGALPVFIMIIFFKHYLAPANDIMRGQNVHTIDRLKDYSRYQLIFEHLRKTVPDFGQWNLKHYGWLLAIILLFGVQINKNIRLSILFSSIILLLTMTGYFFIYVTTPIDLEWHLENSLNRLLIQLYPSFLFLFFFALKPFETYLLSVIPVKKPVVKNVKKGKGK